MNYLRTKRQIERFISILLLSQKHEALKASTKKLKNKVLVGTYHKTGTVWMKKIFTKSCSNLKLKFFSGKSEETPLDFNVFLQNHSKFNFEQLNSEYKGLHLIRDPRDIIISGCFYHQKAHEKCLHIPKHELGGLTYQEKINSYNSLDDKILFEMENSSAYNIKLIDNWDYNNPAFIEVKYEDLILDVDLFLFHKIFTFWGFSGEVIPELLRIAYDNSIFSGNLRKSVHIRSAQQHQCKKYFKPQHKAKFLELYGDILIKLGYEKNNDWADHRGESEDSPR